jgi:hypothetical protein
MMRLNEAIEEEAEVFVLLAIVCRKRSPGLRLRNKGPSRKPSPRCRGGRIAAQSMVTRKRLQELTENYRLSIAAEDLQLLGGVWYITHAGLLRIACRRRCTGIRATLVDRFSRIGLDSSDRHFALTDMGSS